MASLASSVTLQASAFTASPSSVSLRRNVMQVSLGSRAGAMAPLRSRVVMMAAPDLNEKLSQSIKDAEELCDADKGSGECAAAWDEVEEISAEIAHKRVKDSDKKDPLEAFCKDSPEADECRVYED